LKESINFFKEAFLLRLSYLIFCFAFFPSTLSGQKMGLVQYVNFAGRIYQAAVQEKDLVRLLAAVAVKGYGVQLSWPLFYATLLNPPTSTIQI
jgi:hypothetical protein